MNPRERFLAVALLSFIFAAAGGFLGYQFVYRPLRDRDQSIAQLEKEIKERDDRLWQIRSSDLPRLQLARERSLPKDVDFARREYEIELSGLLRKSEFSPSAITIVPRPPETKTSPTVVGKKPAYTKLTFVVQVRGELVNLVDFMQNFYKLQLLQQVRNISIQRTSTSVDRRGQPTGSGELDISMTIEALVLDTAEDRKTLLPVPAPVGLLAGGAVRYRMGVAASESGRGLPFHLTQVLANPPREYLSIAGRNVFFGPPAKEKKDEKPKEPDLGPFVRLTSISRNGDRMTAQLFDFYNHHDYEIEQEGGALPLTRVFYYLNGRKRKHENSYLLKKGELLLGIGLEEKRKRLKIVQVGDEDLFLQTPDEDRDAKMRYGASAICGGAVGPCCPGRVIRWHVGALFKEAKTIPGKEARALMLPKYVEPATGTVAAPPAEAVEAAGEVEEE